MVAACIFVCQSRRSQANASSSWARACFIRQTMPSVVRVRLATSRRRSNGSSSSSGRPGPPSRTSHCISRELARAQATKCRRCQSERDRGGCSDNAIVSKSNQFPIQVSILAAFELIEREGESLKLSPSSSNHRLLAGRPARERPLDEGHPGNPSARGAIPTATCRCWRSAVVVAVEGSESSKDDSIDTNASQKGWLSKPDGPASLLLQPLTIQRKELACRLWQ